MSNSIYFHSSEANPDRSIRHRVDGAEAVWKLEKAYRQASQIRVAQDEFCSGLLSGDELRDHFPQDAALEPLVDVLRGRAKVYPTSSHEIKVLIVGNRLLFTRRKLRAWLLSFGLVAFDFCED